MWGDLGFSFMINLDVYIINKMIYCTFSLLMATSLEEVSSDKGIQLFLPFYQSSSSFCLRKKGRQFVLLISDRKAMVILISRTF